MTGHIRVGGAWKNLAGASVRVGGSWKTVAEAWTRVGGVWKKWLEPAGAFELISTQLISSNTATVTFSSIPQTYKHLQVRFTARSSRGSVACEMFLRLNGISTSSYAYHRLYADGSSIGSFGWNSQNQALIGEILGNTATTNNFASGVVDILDYSSTSKNTTARSFLGTARDMFRIWLGSQLLNNTAAITSISFTLESATSFLPGSRISLYGIKG